jgi:hypothetical protein
MIRKSNRQVKEKVKGARRIYCFAFQGGVSGGRFGKEDAGSFSASAPGRFQSAFPAGKIIGSQGSPNDASSIGRRKRELEDDAEESLNDLEGGPPEKLLFPVFGVD